MMDEVIAKKLEQIGNLLDELKRLLAKDLTEFQFDLVSVRAAERNFQLVVDLASDINTQLLVERGTKTSDTYRQSFTDLVAVGILNFDLAKKLGESAGLRNILVHEYDFDDDYVRFYAAAKDFIPAYRDYLKIIYKYIRGRID